MSNNLPSTHNIALARRNLEAAVAMAWGLYYVQDISSAAADVLRKAFVEQVQEGVALLGLELVERHPKPTGLLECDGQVRFRKLPAEQPGGPR